MQIFSSITFADLLSAMLAGVAIMISLVSNRRARESVEKADEANRIAASGVRPWLSVEVGPTIEFDENPSGSNPYSFDLFAQNFGSSPATSVKLQPCLVRASNGYDSVPELQRLAEEIRADLSGPTIHPGQKLQLGYDTKYVGRALDAKNRDQITETSEWPDTYLVVCVSYRMVDQPQIHFCSAMYLINQVLPNVGTFQLIKQEGDYQGLFHPPA